MKRGIIRVILKSTFVKNLSRWQMTAFWDWLKNVHKYFISVQCHSNQACFWQLSMIYIATLSQCTKITLKSLEIALEF